MQRVGVRPYRPVGPEPSIQCTIRPNLPDAADLVAVRQQSTFGESLSDIVDGQKQWPRLSLK